MAHVFSTERRQNPLRTLDEAVETPAPFVVTRRVGEGNVVMISEEACAGWQETVHRLSSTADARRLLSGIRKFDADSGTEHELVSRGW
ncbi:type II toxin-antitoxin system Phd/YefM family antitoxin [Lichenicola sp.]|uniref:type II toxin-antitoxin system Phd/YefM family antitoxin n=1 Tax=Lichenicola sp. TaxID=2804529 RepID=UPI003AFFB5EF